MTEIYDSNRQLKYANDDLRAIRSMILTTGDHTEYDNAYEIALSVIIINDYLSIGSEIADVKSKYIRIISGKETKGINRDKTYWQVVKHNSKELRQDEEPDPMLELMDSQH